MRAPNSNVPQGRGYRPCTNVAAKNRHPARFPLQSGHPVNIRHCRPIAAFALAFLLALPLRAAEETPQPQTHSIPSPDGEWEYHCDDGFWSGIFKAGTNEMVLDLSNSVEVPYCSTADLLWAPDSQRFAFNYSPPHQPHTTYETSAFYQLRDEKWVVLPSPIDAAKPDSFAHFAKHLPKGMRTPRVWRTIQPRFIFKVTKWADARTASIYAYTTPGPVSSASAFLFTVKFGADDKWEISASRELKGKEIEEAGEK
ncbi:MAG: hypothetical protein ABI946_04975 [Chthoniobacterales bacterium]